MTALPKRQPQGRSVPAWSSDNQDAAIPPRVKLRIYERDGGRCQQCARKVGAGAEPFAFDHIVALINGGKHAESNLQLLCQHCHKAKTGEDVAIKSKTAKVRAKHLGIHKPKSRLQSRGFDKAEPQRSATRPIRRKETT